MLEDSGAVFIGDLREESMNLGFYVKLSCLLYVSIVYGFG